MAREARKGACLR